MNERLVKAEAARKAACLALMETVAEEYPIGSVLEVELGGHLVPVRVTSHAGSWWVCPGYLGGVNTNTGKRRSFCWKCVKSVNSKGKN